MKKKRSVILTTLVCLTTLILFAPLLQQNLKPFRFEALVGYQQPTPKPELTFDSYVSGLFQTQADKYLKENFGFREPLIRMYNQCTYDWFKTTSNREIAVGKDGWLYHAESALQYHGDMESWFGMSTGQVRENLITKARTLSKVNAILKQYGVHLLTFTLPTKSFIYPEHLRWQPWGDTSFNAPLFFERKLDSLGVPHINMIPWFKQVQDTTPFDLYYSKGSHWAAGAPLAVDTMLRYMERLGGQPLARIELGQPYSLDEIPYDDTDLENLLNLAAPLKHEPIHEYPVNVLTDQHSARPSVWFVGTSFYWYMKRRVNFDILFSDRDLLFYYVTLYTDGERKSIPADNLDYLHELLIHDYVVYFRDGPQLHSNGILFPGKALISLCISDERLKEKTDALADSICEAWQAKTHYDSSLCHDKARSLLEQNPELFEELRGDGIPTCRNPRIGQVLTEKAIRNDRNWAFLLYAKANNDSLDARELFMTESYNATHHLPLLRDDTYFTTYDYFDFLVDEICLPSAVDTVKARIQQHAYDNDTLMVMACAMDAFVNEMGKDYNLATIRKQAEEWHLSLDKAFMTATLWCYHHAADKRKYLSEETLLNALEDYQTERAMRNNQEAVDDLMRKHHDLNLPLRLVINRDIKWIQQANVQ